MSEGRRFCENCGTAIHETANFCPNCGAAQRPDPEVPTGPPPPTPEPGRIETPTVPGVPPLPEQGGRSRIGKVLGGCIVILLLLIGLVTCAAIVGGRGEGGGTKTGSESKDEEEEKKTAESKQDKKAAESKQSEPEPIRLSGNGQMATELFNLEEGLSVFRMTHQGDGNFSATLLDEDGQRAGGTRGLDSLLANVIDSFEGSHAVGVEAGRYVLDVQASGPWTITIEQPRPSSALQTTNFTGNSQSATDFFQLSQGLKTFNMTHEGNGNFSVTLLDKNGRRAGGMGGLESLLVNEIGSFDGSKAVRIPEEGIYLLQVQADGPWSIQIE